MADKEITEIITAPKRGDGQKLTIEHFMALAADKPHVSMLEVRDKEEGFFYRLVANEPHRIRRFEELGYEVVLDEKDAKGGNPQVDRRRIFGANELVLMRQPEEYHQLHRAALDKKAAKARRGPIEAFKEKARRAGVEPIDETREVVGPLEAALFNDV